VQICTSYIEAFESFIRQTERQTDTTEIIYDAASWVVINNNNNCEHCDVYTDGISGEVPGSFYRSDAGICVLILFFAQQILL